MYIVQMADLHIGSSAKTEPGEEEFLHKCAELVREKIPEGENILLCLCGDIIDSRGMGLARPEEIQRRYDEAADLTALFDSVLEDAYSVAVRCCPGNHDVTHEEAFYEFSRKLGNTDASPEQLFDNYVYEMQGENGYCIFVSSCMGKQYEVGRIDYKSLEKTLKGLPRESSKILVFHHTIMSMYAEDSSSIRNAARLLSLIDKYNITGVLHGHIHGRESLTLGRNQCNVIGTGALFTRNNPNINSQFNIMQYKNGLLMDIHNYRYNADGGYEPWDIVDLDKNIYENNFEGKTFGEIYERLLSRLDGEAPLYNVAIQIKSDYRDFEDGIQEYLENDYLMVGNKKYDYFMLARMWEAVKVPPELYYNHGSRFKANGKSGIEFVKEQLQRKPASRRIILSTIDMEEVIRSQNDGSFLPLLESMQFGLNVKEKELLVHIKFRSLEVSRFLKLAICEIAYILRELRKKTLDFQKVRIDISAFQVRRRKRFNCYLKAKLDIMSEQSLGAKVNHGKIEDLCVLLKEKRDSMESISRMKGIKTISDAMRASNKEADENAPVYYSDEILEMLDEILRVYQKLDSIHKGSSTHGDEERRYEEKIDGMLGQMILKLQELDAYRREGVR